jgi:PmbA protein
MPSTLEQLVEQTVAIARSQGAPCAEAIAFADTDTSVRVRLGETETIEYSQSKGVGIRILIPAAKGMQQALCSTTDTSMKAIGRMVENAIAMARAAPADPYISEPNPSVVTIEELELADTASLPSAEKLLELALSCEEAARENPLITNSDGADASSGYGEVAMCLNQRFTGSYHSTSFGVSVSVIAGEGLDMQTDYDFASSRFWRDLNRPEFVGQRAAERAVKRLNPVKKPTGKWPVVFDNRVARSLLGTFSGAINGTSIARGTSFLKDAMGTQIFAPTITISDDPMVKRGFGSEPFDAEGHSGSKLLLVEQGVLKHWLLDSRSANQLGLQSNYRAARGLSSSPSPASTNMLLHPGVLSLQELIADIQEGFFVTELFGMGINSVTGDYSQGASGFWIEHGEITVPVAEMTIASNLRDMFRHLTVSNDIEYSSSKNAPALRIDGMTIAGS